MPLRYAVVPDNTSRLSGATMPRIAICAPSTPIKPEDAERVMALAADYPAVELAIHPQSFEEQGHFAGPDERRLAVLLECANDPQVDAVWCARGGYGTNRIAAEAVAGMGEAARSKVFLGYSDSGYLLAALYKAGIGQPVHAPMPVSRSGVMFGDVIEPNGVSIARPPAKGFPPPGKV